MLQRDGGVHNASPEDCTAPNVKTCLLALSRPRGGVVGGGDDHAAASWPGLDLVEDPPGGITPEPPLAAPDDSSGFRWMVDWWWWARP